MGLISPVEPRDESGPPPAGMVEVQDDDDAPEPLANQARVLIATAIDWFKTVETAEGLLRADMQEDLRFSTGEQWPMDVKQSRANRGRPCLTTNRIPQFVRQVVNSSRANKPAIQVNPVDNGADPDTAETLQGICRHVEISSGASMAYETASEHQAKMGRGWIRVVTEYDDDEGFQQAIKIKRVMNPLSVYMGPGCMEADYSDADQAIVTEDLTRKDYKRRFRKSDADMVGLDALMTTGDVPEVWLNNDRIRIAEYWYAKYTPFDIAEIALAGAPGTPPRVLTIPADILRAQQKAFRVESGAGQPLTDVHADQTDIPGVTVLRRRTVQRRNIKVALINAVEILDGNADKTAGRDWPGKWIPIVPVLGDQVYLEGRIDLRGMVRDARDPQRMYNYWLSAATETIALAPRAPWVGAEGQFKNHEAKWGTANSEGWAYLEYIPQSLDGNLVGAPVRKVEEPAIQAIMIALRQADNDLKSVMGLFDPSLGQATSADESGKAILARQRQGEVANSNYADNLARAIRRIGYIIIDLAPKIYDVPTVLRILGDEQDPKKAKNILVHNNRPESQQRNALAPPPADPGQAMQQARQAQAPSSPVDQQSATPPPGPTLDQLAKDRGISGIYNLGVGRYDVTVTVGPSFASRRQEMVDAMSQVLSRAPDLMPVIGDLWFEGMDWPMARQIAKRLKRAVPPHLQDPEDGQPEVPPEAQQQLQQLQQQLQQMQQYVQKLEMEKAAKAQELQAKGQIAMADQQSRERVAAIQAQTESVIAQMEAKSAMAKVQLQGQIDQQIALLTGNLDERLTVLEANLKKSVESTLLRLEASLAPEPAPRASSSSS